MTFVKKVTKNQLFLPLFSMVLVMLVNIIYDVANGNPAFNFFSISINNGILYGRLIDILNRGSEAAILALGMTLVVSSSAGTDISVGSVMSLAGGVCCVLLAGCGNVNVNEYAIPACCFATATSSTSTSRASSSSAATAGSSPRPS